MDAEIIIDPPRYSMNQSVWGVFVSDIREGTVTRIKQVTEYGSTFWQYTATFGHNSYCQSSDYKFFPTEAKAQLALADKLAYKVRDLEKEIRETVDRIKTIREIYKDA